MVSSQLLRSLELARKKLRCSFSAMDGRDITEDFRRKLDEVSLGHKPRFYKFRVEYKGKKGNTLDNEQTERGEIVLILPRHPDEGMLIFYLWIRVKFSSLVPICMQEKIKRAVVRTC